MFENLTNKFEEVFSSLKILIIVGSNKDQHPKMIKAGKPHHKDK